MLKQIIAIIALSVLIILTMVYAQEALRAIVAGHDWVSSGLTSVFSGGEAGNLIRKLLALLTIPLVIALVPAILFWVVKRSWFPYFMHLVWVSWLVQTAALVILYKAGA